MNGGELINTPGYYYALAYWSSAALYCTFLPCRKNVRTCLAARIAYLPVFLLWMICTDGIPQSLFLPVMAVSVFLIFCVFHTTCNNDAAKSVYYCARAFILGEFTASFGWQLYSLYLPRHIMWSIRLRGRMWRSRSQGKSFFRR